MNGMGSTPGSGRSPGGGHGNPLQYSCLRIPCTEEPWGLQSIVSHRDGQDWNNLAVMHAQYLDSWSIQPSRQTRCSTRRSFHQPSSIQHIPVLLYSMYENTIITVLTFKSAPSMNGHQEILYILSHLLPKAFWRRCIVFWCSLSV